MCHLQVSMWHRVISSELVLKKPVWLLENSMGLSFSLRSIWCVLLRLCKNKFVLCKLSRIA